MDIYLTNKEVDGKIKGALALNSPQDILTNQIIMFCKTPTGFYADNPDIGLDREILFGDNTNTEKSQYLQSQLYSFFNEKLETIGNVEVTETTIGGSRKLNFSIEVIFKNKENKKIEVVI